MLVAASFTAANFLQLVIYLVIFVGVIVGAYFVTRWVAGYQKKEGSGKNFEVIETVKVSNGKYLQIVRVGRDDYYIIGVGKEEITYIGKLKSDEIIFTGSKDKKGFSDAFASFRESMKKVGSQKASEEKEDDEQ